MLMSIFKARYGKALIGVCFILMAIYLGAGWQSQKDWHTQYNYLHSDEFIYDYTNHPSYYVKSYDGEKEIPYESMDDYRQDVLTIRKTTDTNDTQMFDNFSFPQSDLILITLFISGFLLFFVDYRTNFTRFLLSLPAHKKEIVRKKMLFISLPIFGALSLGIVGNCLIRTMMIDTSYFTIPLTDMFLSGFSTLLTNLLVFFIGLFFGIALGNLVSGPISVLFILYLSAAGPYFYNSFYQLIHLIFTGNEVSYPDFSLTIDWPEGSTYVWWVYLLYILSMLMIVLLVEKIFLHLSMDNEGDYVTVPALRTPVYWIMSIGTWFYLMITSYFPHQFFYIQLYPDGHYASYQSLMIKSLLLLVLCIVISLLMVYPKELMNWWHKRRNKLA